MRPYEVLVIFSPTAEDTAVNAVLDRVTQIVGDGEGVVGAVDRWGRRRLAYEIQHHRDGYYVLVEASATSAVVSALDRALLLADEVIRHKIVRVPDVVAGGRSAGAPSSAATSPGAATPAAESSTPGGIGA